MGSPYSQPRSDGFILVAQFVALRCLALGDNCGQYTSKRTRISLVVSCACGSGGFGNPLALWKSAPLSLSRSSVFFHALLL